MLPDTNLCWFPGSSRLLQPCNVLWEDPCVSVTCFLNYLLSSSVPNSLVKFTCNDLGCLSNYCENQHILCNTSLWNLLAMRSKNGLTSSVGENMHVQGKTRERRNSVLKYLLSTAAQGSKC